MSDLRKDSKSRIVAKKAMMFIVKEGKKAPDGAVDKANDELKKICSTQLHKGCYFWEQGSKIQFQELDNKGQKTGKIFELSGWLKKIFK